MGSERRSADIRTIEQVAAAAAVLGPCAYLGAVIDVSALPRERVLEALRALAAEERITSLDPVRLAADPEEHLEHLDLIDRAEMHGRAASALDRFGEGRPEIVRHLLAAPGEGKRRWVDLLVDEADALMAIGRSTAALELLDRAMREPPGPDRASDLLGRIGRARLDSGRPAAAAEICDRVLADPELEPELRRSVEATLFSARVAMDEPGRAIHGLVGAIDREQEEEGVVALELALLRELPGDPLVFEEAVRRFASRVDDPRAESRPALRREGAHLLSMQGEIDPETALAMLGRPAEAARGVRGDPRALIRAGWLALRAEAPEAASELIGAAGRSWLGQGNFLSALEGVIEVRFGSVGRGVELLSGALEAAREDEAPFTIAVCRAFLPQALLEAGRSAAPSAVEESWKSTGVPGWIQRIGQARLLAEGREHERAVRLLRQVDEEMVASGLTNPAGYEHLDLAVASLLSLGRDDEAAATAQDNLDRLGAWEAPAALARARTSKAITLGGAEGLEMIEAALMLAERSASRRTEALVALSAGRKALLLGERAQAIARFNQVLDVSTRIGAGLFAQRAFRQLSALGEDPRRAASAGASSLTPAELRVARAAAGGLSNKAIAESLHLSVRTVENQLRKVYSKLGTDRANLGEKLGHDEDPIPF